MSWLVIGAGNALNCSMRKMYDDDQKVVPRIAILGDSNIDANYHFAFSPTDVVELVDDQVEPMRTITVLPLTTVPDSHTDFWFYDPYNHQEISRHVESAKVVPMPSDLKEMLKERAQAHPARALGGACDGGVWLEDEPLCEEPHLAHLVALTAAASRRE